MCRRSVLRCSGTLADAGWDGMTMPAPDADAAAALRSASDDTAIPVFAGGAKARLTGETMPALQSPPRPSSSQASPVTLEERAESRAGAMPMWEDMGSGEADGPPALGVTVQNAGSANSFCDDEAYSDVKKCFAKAVLTTQRVSRMRTD